MKEKTMRDICKMARKLAKPYRVTDGDGFRLKDISPADTLDLKAEDKPRAQEALAVGVETLATLQDADAGTIRLGDLDVRTGKDRLRQVLGYLPQEFGVYPKVTAADLKSIAPELLRQLCC